MPSYTYTARDREGNPVQGLLVGANLEAVRESLRERDLYLTNALVQDETAQTSVRIHSRRRANVNDMVIMSRQLATLVRAGMPLNECLHTVAQQSDNMGLRGTLQLLRNDILGGASFADAAARHPSVFPEFYVALIRAGEAGGVLDETLETAALQFDREADMREKIKTAVTYPIIVVFTAVFVVGFLVVFIIPQFAKVYADFRAPLPPITLALVALSNLVITPIVDIIVIGGSVLGFFAMRQYITTPKGRHLWDSIKLAVPVAGKLTRKIAIARFTRTLAAMTRSGVPILKALAISARVSDNAIIAEAVTRVADYVQQGARIWMPMEQTGQFPPMVTRMIAAGEESGNLDKMLTEVTAFYDRDIEYTIQKMTRLMEPALTVVIGTVVLFVLLALYMPIFRLTQVIRR